MQVEEMQLNRCGETSDKKLIYIVDDDDSVRRALKLLLSTYGFEVETFSSAEQFLRDVPHNTPGCLILDIHMPGLNGWETLQCLYTSGSKRSVIIVSAAKNGGLTEQALKAGAKGFLQKPFNDQDLINMVNKEF